MNKIKCWTKHRCGHHRTAGELHQLQTPFVHLSVSHQKSKHYPAMISILKFIFMTSQMYSFRPDYKMFAPVESKV